MGYLGDPASRTSSRLLTEMIQTYRILQPRPNNYPNFLKLPPKTTKAPKQQEVGRRTMPTYPKDGLWMLIII